MWIAFTLAGALLGGLAMGSLPDWYSQLARPSWTPPPWVFGPMWTFLYITMAVAAEMTWRRSKGNSLRPWAFGGYAVQMALNALWPLLFFRFQLLGFAFIELLILWVMILGTLILFWRIRRIGGILLIPYLLWVALAASLNGGFWFLNR